MNYLPGEPHSFGAAHARSRQHHDDYAADREKELEQLYGANPRAFDAMPGGFTGALNGLRQSLMQQRSQAMFNAPMDAYMQEVQDAGFSPTGMLRGLLGSRRK